MTDDFLTNGFEDDRYVKARQLKIQFEEELERELRRIGDQIVSQNPEQFSEPVEGRESSSTRSNSLPYKRIDYPMQRIRAPDDDTQLTLNVHLYWVDPTDYDRRDIDGALAALGYKIKDVAAADEQRVQAESRDGPLRTAENRFGGETAFYGHVTSAGDLEETGDQLVEHFSTYGNQYGVPQEASTGH